MGRKSNQVLILALCAMVSCVKDKPTAQNTVVPTDKSGVYVACEGQYTAGNATLYLYKPTQDSVYGDLYANTNNHQTLGDVFQSITPVDNRLFLAINHSDMVIALSAADLKTTGSITIPSPRYIVPVSSSKAFVCSLYHNKVYVINTSSLALTDSITLPATNTEGMYLYGTDVYVAVWDTTCHSIYKIDAATNQITQTININGYAPHSILADREQMLWVLSGNQAKGRQSYWTRIDPSTGNILASYAFPVAAEPIKPVFNNTRDTLYFIEANYYGGTTNNGIYRMGIHETSLPATAFVPTQRYQYYWALGIDPATGYIYVGDPKGFNQGGTVAVYKQNGTQVKSFNVGVGPGMFLFVE